MHADLMEITARSKAYAANQSAISDFSFRPSGQISEADLLGSPDWTLYCLDLPSKRALFVGLPSGSDLPKAAFAYVQQFTAARRAALMSFDQLIAASRRITPPADLTILFSTGRCGSTLASRILSRVPKVWSLSEPDYLTNLAVARLTLAPDELTDLIRAATLWTCRPPGGRSPETIVIKPRSEPVLIANACQRAFPASRNIFMYRDYLGYTNSCFKFIQRVMGPEDFFAEGFFAGDAWLALWDFVMVGLPVSYLEEWIAPDHGPIDWAEFLTLVWSLRIEGYLRALRQGMTFTAIHYQDLNIDRVKETTRLLETCGVSVQHLDQAITAFAEDSQKGSVGANVTPARPLNANETARAVALLARMGRRDYVDGRLPDSHRTGS